MDHKQNDNEEAPDIDIDDFLRQGGLDLDDINDEKASSKTFTDSEEKKEAAYNTESDENMKGWLTKSSIKMEKDGGDILAHMINGIGNGLKAGFKIFTETI